MTLPFCARQRWTFRRQTSAALVAAAVSVSMAWMPQSTHAGVTVTSIDATGASAWPDAPTIATVRPNATNLVAENLDGGRVVAQTFTPTAALSLGSIPVMSAGGGGDNGINLQTIHLFDVNLPHSLPGSYNLSTDTSPSPAVDMFGGGAGLPTPIPGSG